MFEINSSIEVPVRGRIAHRVNYPFAEMEIGQSFFMDLSDLGDPDDADLLEKRIRNRMSKTALAARAYREQTGEDFYVTCRRFGPQHGFPSDEVYPDAVGVRVWRIEAKTDAADAPEAPKKTVERKKRGADVEDFALED